MKLTMFAERELPIRVRVCQCQSQRVKHATQTSFNTNTMQKVTISHLALCFVRNMDEHRKTLPRQSMLIRR